MKLNTIPLVTQLGLIIWLISLFIYMNQQVSATTTFAKLVIVATPIVFCLAGLISAWAGKNALVPKLTFSVADILVIAGVCSFALLQAPATINLLGGVLIIGGILLGLVAAVLMSRTKQALHKA